MRRALLAAVVSLLLLAAFVLVVGPLALARQLAGTNLSIFVLGLVSMTAALVVWSEGLRPLLVVNDVETSRWRIFVAYTAAMFGRQALPLGAVGGPAVTAYAVEREIDRGYDETLAIVVVAEFLSTIASLTMAGVGVALLLGTVADVAELRVLVYGTVAFGVIFLTLTGLFLVAREGVRRVLLGGAHVGRVTVGRVSPRLDAAFTPGRTNVALDRFYGTVDRLAADRSTIAVVFGLHLLGWLLAAIPLYTSAVALGAQLSVAFVLVLVPTMGLVDVLPLPGGLGGVEIVLGTLIAAVTGLSVPLAGAVVLLYRLCTYWFLLLVGLVASAYAVAGVPGIDR